MASQPFELAASLTPATWPGPLPENGLLPPPGARRGRLDLGESLPLDEEWHHPTPRDPGLPAVPPAAHLEGRPAASTGAPELGGLLVAALHGLLRQVALPDELHRLLDAVLEAAADEGLDRGPASAPSLAWLVRALSRASAPPPPAAGPRPAGASPVSPELASTLTALLLTLRHQPASCVEQRSLTPSASLDSHSARLLELEQQLAYQRRIVALDPLTELPNRRGLQAWLEQHLGGTEPVQRSFSLLIYDLDHFKQVNDRWGHLVGDRVLVAVAERLGRAFRRQDCLCRYGGEEFCAVLPGTTWVAARAVAERTLQAMRSAPVQWRGGSWPVTVSVGIAEHAPDERFAETFLRADAALYAAKAAGRDRAAVAPPP